MTKCAECDETKGLVRAFSADEIDPTTGQMPVVWFCERHFQELVEQ